MKNVVVTGSTRGIGFGLAESFLELGCTVVVSGRSEAAVQEAVDKLGSRYQPERILGVSCDVQDSFQVQSLWDQAREHFDHVDIWINNAGISGSLVMAWELSAEEAKAIVETNLLGTIHGVRVAVNGMMVQGSGAIYNLEGLGSSGPVVPGTAVYATTKAGITQFTKVLAVELKETPLVVGSLRPGMVITDLVMQQFDDKPEDQERVRRVFNIFADRLENVTPWMAGRILGNRKSGAVISYASAWSYLGRLLSYPFTKRDVFSA